MDIIINLIDAARPTIRAIDSLDRPDFRRAVLAANEAVSTYWHCLRDRRYGSAFKARADAIEAVDEAHYAIHCHMDADWLGAAMRLTSTERTLDACEAEFAGQLRRKSLCAGEPVHMGAMRGWARAAEGPDRPVGALGGLQRLSGRTRQRAPSQGYVVALVEFGEG